MQERRPIRSFVLRQGRISNAQRRAHADLLPVYGVAFSPAALDLDRVFGRAAPKILEIGFGMGETTATIAQQHPEKDFLGVEVQREGRGRLSRLTIAHQDFADRLGIRRKPLPNPQRRHHPHTGVSQRRHPAIEAGIQNFRGRRGIGDHGL